MPFVWRYSFAFLGGFLAMFVHIYLLFGRGDWLAPQRLSDAIGNALIFAHIVALMVIVARYSPEKFPKPISIIGAILLGTLAWWSHTFFFLFNTSPDWTVLLIGGIGLSAGFILAQFLQLPNRFIKMTIATLISAIAIYLPIYFSYQNHLATGNLSQALLYFRADDPEHLYLIGIPFALSIAFFGHLPLLFSSSPLEAQK
jgi:hypothetical protein